MDDTLNAFQDDLVRQDKSTATVRNYVNDVDLFIRWETGTYGDFSLSKVVQRDIIEYRSFLLTSQNASPATINRRLASLSSFFNWCIATKRIKSKVNPAFGVKGITITDAGPRAMETRQVRRLLREVHVHGNSRDIAVLEVLCGTGIRVGELVTLTLGDVEISERKGSLFVRSGKGRSSRELPLNTDVRKALQGWLEVRPATLSNYVFTGQRGERMTSSGIWRIVKKYAQFAGVPGLRVHDLRHTVLTRLVREFGMDLVTVARISGHRNLKTLMRYAEPTRADLAAAVEKLAFTGE